MYCWLIILCPKWHNTLGRVPLGPPFRILKELINVDVARPSSRVARGPALNSCVILNH